MLSATILKLPFKLMFWNRKKKYFEFQTDSKALLEYVELFIDSYKDLIDFDFNHLKDG